MFNDITSLKQEYVKRVIKIFGVKYTGASNKHGTR